MFHYQDSWDSGVSWVRFKSRYLARSLTVFAVNALYAYIGIELVCSHGFLKCICSPSLAWRYCWRSREPKTQYSNWYVSILDLDALLTGCQPSAAVSFIQPHVEYILTLVAAFIRIAIFYIGGVFVIGLIVPSNADVFIGGSDENKIAASPFVHGKYTQPPFMAHIVRGADAAPGSCAPIWRQCIRAHRQRGPTRVHLLRGQLPALHRVSDALRPRAPRPGAADLPEGQPARRAHARARLLLVLCLTRVSQRVRGAWEGCVRQFGGHLVAPESWH